MYSIVRDTNRLSCFSFPLNGCRKNLKWSERSDVDDVDALDRLKLANSHIIHSLWFICRLSLFLPRYLRTHRKLVFHAYINILLTPAQHFHCENKRCHYPLVGGGRVKNTHLTAKPVCEKLERVYRVKAVSHSNNTRSHYAAYFDHLCASDSRKNARAKLQKHNHHLTIENMNRHFQGKARRRGGTITISDRLRWLNALKSSR